MAIKDSVGLARRMHGKEPNRAVELAVVSSVNPLKIVIGQNSEYSSEYWNIYEAWFNDKDGEFTKPGKWKNGTHTGASVNCSEGSISQMTYTEDNWQSGEYEERKAYMKYNVGDLIAVQEMEGGKSFIILCKVRRVE